MWTEVLKIIIELIERICWEQIGEENNFGETESNEDIYPYCSLVNQQGLQIRYFTCDKLHDIQLTLSFLSKNWKASRARSVLPLDTSQIGLSTDQKNMRTKGSREQTKLIQAMVRQWRKAPCVQTSTIAATSCTHVFSVQIDHQYALLTQNNKCYLFKYVINIIFCLN